MLTTVSDQFGNVTIDWITKPGPYYFTDWFHLPEPYQNMKVELNQNPQPDVCLCSNMPIPDELNLRISLISDDYQTSIEIDDITRNGQGSIADGNFYSLSSCFMAKEEYRMWTMANNTLHLRFQLTKSNKRKCTYSEVVMATFDPNKRHSGQPTGDCTMGETF